MKGRGDKYIRRVHTEIVKMFKSLEKEGLRVHPKHIGEREVNHWIGMFPPGRFGTQRNAQYHLDIMQVFLKAIGNNIIPEMDIRLDTTVRLAWMPSYDEAEHVWATAQRIGGLERFGVYCAQFLGLRRTALIRMKTEWYRDGTLYVTSKGSRKGKTRKISPPHDFDYEWNLAMRARDEIISHAVVDWDWRGPIPDHVFLNYSCRNGLSHHRESAMDRMIKAIGKEAHYPKISWHPLRRRFGRNMYDAGVDLEIIRDILGHSDLDTTRKYIMLDLEDQKGAFQALAKYRRTKEEVLTERIRAISTVNWGR